MPQVSRLNEGIGWKKLGKILQTIETAINANDPLRGHGILIDETPTGSIISRAPKETDDKADQQEDGIVGPCNIRFYDVSFMGATIVDPTTCKQTFVQVLVQDPGGWVDFDADIQLPGTDHPATFGG